MDNKCALNARTMSTSD